jgi:hypothetical protein
MSTKQLPVALLIAGATFKAVLVLSWRFWNTTHFAKLLTVYDPGAVYFAEKVTALFFDQRRIAPPPAESALFEVFLVIGFGVQCFLVGLLLRWLILRIGGRTSSPATAT